MHWKRVWKRQGGRPVLDKKILEKGPMLAESTDILPTSGKWTAEFKWDGMRALFTSDGRSFTIFSRNNRDVTGSFPEFQDVVFKAPIILDGEIISTGENKIPDFHMLQKRMHRTNHLDRLMDEYPVTYMVFDLLQVGFEKMVRRPFHYRRRILRSHMPDHPRIQLSRDYRDNIEQMKEVALDKGLEGLMLKKIDSTYKPGRRSGSWLKYKFVKTADLIIGGWKPRKGTGKGVGSLLLGAYEDEGPLQYVGSVGTGFDMQDHLILIKELKDRESSDCPFYKDPKIKDEIFVKPEMVVEVHYRRWPSKGKIQQASFKGIRDYKDPREVRLPDG